MPRPKELRTIVRPVRNPGSPDLPWCLEWQTTRMPGPAFWYFATESEAHAAADRMGPSRVYNPPEPTGATAEECRAQVRTALGEIIAEAESALGTLGAEGEHHSLTHSMLWIERHTETIRRLLISSALKG